MVRHSLLGIACMGSLALCSQAYSQAYSQSVQVTQRDTHNWAFGVNLATTNVNSLDNSVFAYGAFGDYFLSPNFSLGFSLDYWSDSFDASGSRLVEVDDLVLGGHGRFLFPEFSPGFRPFALAGLAVHRFQVDVANRDPTAEPLVDKFNEYDRDTQNVSGELGVDFAGGVSWRVQPAMDLVAEARYRRMIDRTVDLDQMNYSVALSYVL